MSESTIDACRVYAGSDGGLTKRFYAELEARGTIGIVALNLFRAQKCSSRAKVYRGGTGGRSFRDMAYERKEWSLKQLAEVLTSHGGELGITFGWGRDKSQAHNSKDWDGQRLSAERIVQFCQKVFESERKLSNEDSGANQTHPHC